MSQPDAVIEGYGALDIIQPLTQRAREWVEEHVEYESWQMVGTGIAVEPRLVPALAEGMRRDNLTVEGEHESEE